MKQFVVLQKIGVFSATVVREFDNKGNAQQYCELMQTSEDNERVKYYVAEIIM